MTPLQQRFVEEFILDLNATAAIIRAGSKSARPQEAASEMLRNPEVAQAIAREILHHNQSTGITVEWWVERVSLMARANIAEILGDDTKLFPPAEWPKAFRLGMVTQLSRRVPADEDDGSFKVRLANKVRLLRLIGRHKGLWSEGRKRIGSSIGSFEASLRPPPPPATPLAVEETAGLTHRQRIFVQAYLSGKSASQAAQLSGSRASNLRQAGYEMLKAHKVRAVIDAAENKARSRKRLSHAMRRKSVIEILNADLSDIFDGLSFNLLPFSKWPTIWQSGALVRLPPSRQLIEGGRSFNLTLIDRTPLLEMVGLWVGAFERSRRPREVITVDELLRRRDRVSKAHSDLLERRRGRPLSQDDDP